ncbi:MAG: DUF2145 domain-containing protein [Gammaproteobacteria bacterium]
MPDFLRRAAAVLVPAIFASFAAPAFAEGECPTVRMGAEGHRKAAQLAAKVLAHLQTTDAKVVLLGRAGSDAPQKRFGEKIGFWNYTHAGLAYRNHPAGEWTVAHLLNICGEESGVFEESFLKFYLDNPHEYRAVAAVPSAPMQDALEDLIVRRNAAAGYRNGSVYSSISHPFSLARQNSNEYILDTFAAALARAEDAIILSREDAKEYFLSSAHRDKFAPEIIRTNFFEALGASLGFGPGNATLDDHTPAERAAGRFEFVSVGSLIQFLDELGMLQSAKEFALKDVSKARDTIVEK